MFSVRKLTANLLICHCALLIYHEQNLYFVFFSMCASTKIKPKTQFAVQLTLSRNHAPKK